MIQPPLFNAGYTKLNSVTVRQNVVTNSDKLPSHIPGQSDGGNKRCPRDRGSLELLECFMCHFASGKMITNLVLLGAASGNEEYLNVRLFELALTSVPA